MSKHLRKPKQLIPVTTNHFMHHVITWWQKMPCFLYTGSIHGFSQVHFHINQLLDHGQWARRHGHPKRLELPSWAQILEKHFYPPQCRILHYCWGGDPSQQASHSDLPTVNSNRKAGDIRCKPVTSN